MKLGKPLSDAEMKRRHEFNTEVEAIVRATGAAIAVVEEPRTNCGATLSIQTPAGELHVTPYGTWIACRFQNVAQAKRMLPYWPRDDMARLNGCSGKWNFQSGQRDWDLQAFKRELGALLKTQGGSAFWARVMFQPATEPATCCHWQYGWLFASKSEGHANDTLRRVTAKDVTRRYRLEECLPGDIDYPKGG